MSSSTFKIENHLTGHQDLDEKLKEWFNWDQVSFKIYLLNFMIMVYSLQQNQETRDQMTLLVSNKKIDLLRRLLLSRLCFGTAGIRGIMQTGYIGMNDLVIIQTSQGLCRYILSHYGSSNEVKSKGVIIGFDGRYNSRRFAERSAVAFLSQGIKVYLFNEVVPTPFIPFGIRVLGCLAGIVVTASHNPKEDNGYKVYFDNGAQITSPHDKNIQESILNNLEPWTGAWSRDLLTQVIDPMDAVSTAYFSRIKETNCFVDPAVVSKTPLKFTYTSLHGVGHKFITRAFQECGFPSYTATPEQKDPDPDFPTVKFPNPEEGKGVLDLSIKTAESIGSTIIVANDPDADRCAVAEKQADGSWRVLNGNEIGALLAWWSWKVWKKTNPDVDPKDCYMISTAVSSKICQTMAKKEGFIFVETLTGFKWMGNLAHKLINEGKKVIFAFEEAIGFMFDP